MRRASADLEKAQSEKGRKWSTVLKVYLKSSQDFDSNVQILNTENNRFIID